MPDLILGPLLRYAGAYEATVWVETDARCEVEVRVRNLQNAGGSARTFSVGGHHYALVRVASLQPGGAYEYEVLLDGEKRWPEDGSGFPPSVIRTVHRESLFRLVFGSCRVSAPHEPPYTLNSGEDERGLGVDALYALAMRLRDGPEEALPHALLLLGDQIYAHKPPFETLGFIRLRRDTDLPPGEAVADFEEYARLYRDSWTDPAIRWLLSTVPSAMIFDDHEVDDDWNISYSWVEEMRTQPWWDEQIIGGYASYWIYQHLGNLSPKELETDDLYKKVRKAGDAKPILREFAYHTHRRPEGMRWSFHRDFGNTRLLVIDSRGGRVLEENRRSMVDADQWEWIKEKANGDFDHLLLGTSLPVLLGPGVHYLQAWNEAVCSGAWGRRAAGWAENLRRSQDLDHWSSFHDSFEEFAELVRAVAAGEKGAAPASVVILSGDVHHSYLAEAKLRDGCAESRIYQAVCSPLRNSLPGQRSRLQSAGWTGPGELAGRLLSRLVGIGEKEIDWRKKHERLFFENQVATLSLNGRSAGVTFEKAVPNGLGETGLEKLHEYRFR